MQLRHLYMFVIDTGVAELRNYDIGETLRCKVTMSILSIRDFSIFANTISILKHIAIVLTICIHSISMAHHI